MPYNYDFAVAQTLLTDAETKRLVCILLYSNDNLPCDWEKATEAYGSASVNSMRTVYSGILKKIADAGGRIDRETGAKQAAKPKATKKRKNDGDDDNAADSQATPKPAKTPRKQKEKAVLSDEFIKAEDDTGGLNFKTEPHSVAAN